MKVKQNLSSEKKKNVLRGPKTPKKLKSVIGSKQKLKNNVVSLSGKLNDSKLLSTSLVTHPPSPKVTKANPENTLDITPKMVEQSLKVVFDVSNEFKKNLKVLPVNNRDFVYLQVVWMKKPDVPEKRRKYFKLHHGLFGDDPEVCLFVNNWIIHDHAKRTPDEKIEASVDHFEEYLKHHGVEGISTIMPLFQFKTEYSSYEAQRKLVDRFDLFLCQAGLLEVTSFLNKLGIAFNKKNKVPLSVKFPATKKPNEKFKNRVQTLLRTSWYQLKPHSDTVSLRVGSLDLSQEQLKENIVYVLNQLKTDTDALPGGVDNVRSIMLKTSRSKAIPLFINLASPSNLPVPQLKSLRPVPNSIEGDLSTQPGKKVTVLPSGEVFVTDDTDDEFHYDSDEKEDEEKEEESQVNVETEVEKVQKRKISNEDKEKVKKRKLNVKEDKQLTKKVKKVKENIDGKKIKKSKNQSGLSKKIESAKPKLIKGKKAGKNVK